VVGLGHYPTLAAGSVDLAGTEVTGVLPVAPELTSPAGGAANVAVPLTLSWLAASDAAVYDVFLGPQGSNLALLGTTANLSWVVRGLNPGASYCWMISARNECGSADSAVRCFGTAGEAASADALFVIAAHAAGASSSNWVTDTMIFNGTDHSVPYQFYFTPGSVDGNSTPYHFNGTIEAGQAVANPDIVKSLFGLSEAIGNLRLESDAPLYLTSRTYNLTSTGTTGQFVAGLPAASGVGACTLPVGEKGQLLGVVQSNDFRTNVGVMEVAGRETFFTVRVYSPLGAMIHSSTGSVNAYSWWQKSIGELGVPVGENLRAEFEVTSGGAVLPYASVVDKGTNDGYYVPGQKASEMALLTHQLIAVVGRTSGQQNTDWRSNVHLYNPTGATQTVTMQFFSQGPLVTNSVEVLPGRTVKVKDVVSELFGSLTGDVAGSLHLTAERGLLAISNSFNETEKGTYGQFIPARAIADLLVVNDFGHILQLARNASYRSNIGFSEYSGVATEVELIIFGVDGKQLGKANFRIPPFSNLQVNDVFRNLNIQGDVSAAQARVRVLSGGAIYAYASVVDNRTGDATFVPALKPASHPGNLSCP